MESKTGKMGPITPFESDMMPMLSSCPGVPGCDLSRNELCGDHRDVLKMFRTALETAKGVTAPLVVGSCDFYVDDHIAVSVTACSVHNQHAVECARMLQRKVTALHEIAKHAARVARGDEDGGKLSELLDATGDPELMYTQ